MRFPEYNRKLAPAENRARAADYVRVQGTNKRPLPPRGLIVQSAPRGFLVVWSLPDPYKDIAGWRIYKDAESSLYKEISDRATRQVYVESTASSSASPKINVFISSVNAFGRESRKVQAQGSAVVESSPPASPVPPPPAGYTAEKSGGADRTVRDRTRVGMQL